MKCSEWTMSYQEKPTLLKEKTGSVAQSDACPTGDQDSDTVTHSPYNQPLKA